MGSHKVLWRVVQRRGDGTLTVRLRRQRARHLGAGWRHLVGAGVERAVGLTSRVGKHIATGDGGNVGEWQVMVLMLMSLGPRSRESTGHHWRGNSGDIFVADRGRVIVSVRLQVQRFQFNGRVGVVVDWVLSGGHNGDRFVFQDGRGGGRDRGGLNFDLVFASFD